MPAQAGIQGCGGVRLTRSKKRIYLHALDIYASSPFLDFEDALAIAHMARRGVTEIVSYDRDFDRIAGLRRAEP